MITRSIPRNSARAIASLALLLLPAVLAGCAAIGDSAVSQAFVDPAKYDNFDCKQLETERNTLASRTAELQGLIDKAETGTAGSVVGVLAYRNDYISARASARLAEETWQRNKCVAGPLPVVPAVPAAKGARRT